MEKVIFTTLCMVEDKNKNVLVQEHIGGKWESIAFPGGHVEAGESFVGSVIREVFEETGYTIEGRVFWADYEKLNRYKLAVDTLEMLPLFEDDTKSEFYYYKDETNK